MRSFIYTLIACLGLFFAAPMVDGPVAQAEKTAAKKGKKRAKVTKRSKKRKKGSKASKRSKRGKRAKRAVKKPDVIE